MLKSISSGLLFFIAMFFVSCNDSTVTPPSDDPGHPLPLRQGNFWLYDMHAEDSSGTTITTMRDTLNFNVVKDTLVNGQHWFELPDFFDRDKKVYYSYKSNSRDLWYMQEGLEGLLFRYPVKSGDSYAVEGGTISVISLNENITTPKGSFSTIHYRMTLDNDNTSFDWYIKPDLGIVRMRVFTMLDMPGPNEPGYAVWDLFDYNASK